MGEGSLIKTASTIIQASTLNPQLGNQKHHEGTRQIRWVVSVSQVVWMPFQDSKRAVELFQQYYSRQLVGKRHFSQ